MINKIKTKLIYWLIGKNVSLLANVTLDEHSFYMLSVLSEKRNLKVNCVNVEVVTLELNEYDEKI